MVTTCEDGKHGFAYQAGRKILHLPCVYCETIMCGKWLKSKDPHPIRGRRWGRCARVDKHKDDCFNLNIPAPPVEG